MNQEFEPPLRIFIVDDDREMRGSLIQFLSRSGCVATAFPAAEAAEAALSGLEAEQPDVVVSDVRMPGASGLDLLGRIDSLTSPPPVLLITAHGDVPMAVDAMKAGAFDFIEKPFQPARLFDAIKRAAAFGRLKNENVALRESLRRLSGLDAILVGASTEMRRLREDIEDIAKSDAPVLILGETGTGKELAARALHDLSARSGSPFVAVNCATIPLSDFEAGAASDTNGTPASFARADTGTLFLDELGVCQPEIQAKLLRVIDPREITPTSDTEPRRADIRILSASNQRLDEAVAAGAFREDLYYRLNTVVVSIPPLRERGDDICLLFAHFAAQYADLYEIAPPETTNDDLAALMTHDWPGNVRELRHVAERRVLAARRGRGSISEAIRPEGEHDSAPATLREAVAAFEHRLIGRAIRTHCGRMDAVAEALGIGRRTLNEKIVKLGLNKKEFL